MSYDFSTIEKKWQKKWDKEKTFKVKDDHNMKKWYGLIEFPYPSGEGLHVGHPRSYTALDVIARKRRMEGYNVLYPIGFDAFGLPAENYAIKTNIHPKITTEKNIKNFTRQLKSLGFSFDWDRCINTTEPSYYKWTQWIFIQLYKKGLAYKTTMPINFCTSCKVGLANEEVVGGVCERCGSEVIQKEKSEWMLKITDYAERLIDDLDKLDYIPQVKLQQKNWIGKSEGAELVFNVKGYNEGIKVYTTRPDTIFGATYMVMSPEHKFLKDMEDKIENLDEIKEYQISASKKSAFERSELNKEKTGVEIKGIKAINPANNKEIPIWISDYVLTSYGTGAIMAVPAHDDRDYEFAKKFNLPIIEVIKGKNSNIEKEAYTGDGVIINSGDFLNGLGIKEGKEAAIKFFEEKKKGTRKTNYKLRDWVFSRQRYWGEPIPMIYCDKCGWNPIDEKDLPLVLPEVEEFKPGENGESPLALLDDWKNTKCPVCGGKAVRETDTMPQWAGSSWYYLRYMDPFNDKELVSKENAEYFGQVDWYNGGMEHTTLHLLYSRFWHKFLYDIGVVPYDEPYQKRTSHGMILGPNGEKMSKSKGNVINPDDVVKEFGADTLRLYEMFMGPFNEVAAWSTDSIRGCAHFLDRVWNMQNMITENKNENIIKSLNRTIKKVSEDIENMKFNTAISSFMIFVNDVYKEGEISKENYITLLTLMNPFVPHITEELNRLIGKRKQISSYTWPTYDESLIKDETYELVVQVNGKIRGRKTLNMNASEEEMKKEAKTIENVNNYLDGKEIIKTIVIKNKLINFIVK